MPGTEDQDPISERLTEFADELERVLLQHATIRRKNIFGGAVSFTPRRDGALGVSWIDLGFDLQVETHGGLGGRWELGRSLEDVSSLEDVVRSIIAGRVTEVKVANRSRVTVTLANGRKATETGAQGLSGCLPIPFWPRWGPRTRYLPYVP